jgi:hypothetical protein
LPCQGALAKIRLSQELLLYPRPFTSFLSFLFLCSYHADFCFSLLVIFELEDSCGMMNSSQKRPQNNRNKLLHRFYEPLVLLHVLDSIQGDHVPRQREDSQPPDHTSRTELRRRFLESLAYVCDYDKGGDTVTAIFVSSAPLTYHVASNKSLKETNKVVPFLDSLLKKLRTLRASTLGDERRILEKCVAFSGKRVMEYWRSLQKSLMKCINTPSNTEVLHRK